MAALSPIWLVIGLGNPGEAYENTRHNLGWKALDWLTQDGDLQNVVAKRVGRRFSWSANLFESVHEADCAGKRAVMMKPRTFVNGSGRAVKKLLSDYDAAAANIIVVCDDINLDVGAIRVRASGGSGNHNGLKSIIDALQTEEFARVRIGVGQPPRGAREWQNYVLKQAPARQRPALDAAVQTAAAAVKVALADGVEAAMNRYNRAPLQP